MWRGEMEPHKRRCVCVAMRDGATQWKVCMCGKDKWSHISEGVCVLEGEMEPHEGRIECVARRDGAT